MGNYNVRKISDLDPADSIDSEDLFYVSQKGGDENVYSSKKTSFGTISENIVSAAIDRARDVFAISAGVNIQGDLLDKVNAMISGESTLSAVSFGETPVMLHSQPARLSDIQDNALVTKKTAVAIVDADKSYISPDSTIDCRPGNADGYTKYSDRLLEWHFNPGGRDSSEYVPQSGAQRTAGYVRCGYTGLLTMYGWLADNGGVLPEECWVGVFGRVKCFDQASGQYVEEDVALAVQPWPIGANSQVAQYVGFQLPVKEGLSVKIKTGFNVNGSNSGFGNAHSLMLNDPSAGGNMPNTFVGYILH